MSGTATWADILTLGFFETKEQKQIKDFQAILEKKDCEYKLQQEVKQREREAAREAGLLAGHLCVSYHPGARSLSKTGTGEVWSCCGGKLTASSNGCEEKWVSESVHMAEACTSGCSIHTFYCGNSWISPQQWDKKCKGGHITPLGLSL